MIGLLLLYLCIKTIEKTTLTRAFILISCTIIAQTIVNHDNGIARNFAKVIHFNANPYSIKINKEFHNTNIEISTSEETVVDHHNTLSPWGFFINQNTKNSKRITLKAPERSLPESILLLSLKHDLVVETI